MEGKTIFMKFIFSLLLTSISLFSIAQSYSRAKVLTDEAGLAKLVNLGIAIDHGTHKKNSFFISDFSSAEIKAMRDAGFTVEIQIEDVKQFYVSRNAVSGPTRNTICPPPAGQNPEPIVPSNFQLGSMGGFFTYQEMLDQLDLMATLYPNLISARDTISNFTSVESRPIYWLRISDNANSDENEPEVLYSAIHHAREPLSLSNTIFYMWFLLENYATNPEIKYLVDESEMYFVPMINPDGYIYNQTTDPSGGGMWRKNRKNNLDGTFGVDLNRNYSSAWGTTGISMVTSADVYPGKNAFSEPETQAMKWFCENRDFLFAFNAHTYSNLILFPLGITATDFADDHDFFQNIGNVMVQYNSFVAQKASDLYPASGDSDDYMYLEDLGVKPKIFAFTPEIGSDEDGFWPGSDRIIPLSQDMLHANLTLVRAAHNYWTVEDLDASAITSLSGNFTHKALRLGIDETDVTVSITPLQGITSVGAPVVHDLALNQSQDGSISYQLNAGIALGDPIRYVLVSDFGSTIQRDTIDKVFGNPPLKLFDDATNTDNWTGNWSLTSESYYSASNAFTDSPNTDYANMASKTFTLPALNLTGADQAKISFYARWDIESNYDYARLEVSTDGGSSWIGQCGKYTVPGTSASGSVQPQDEPVYEGTQLDWVLEEINLSDYLGQNILLRFILQSDGGKTADGFYFDDFKLYHNSTQGLEDASSAAAFQVFPSPAQNSLSIAHQQNMKGYRVKLLDANGRVLLQEKIEFNTNLYELELSGIPSGFYVTELENNDGQVTRVKILVAK